MPHKSSKRPKNPTTKKSPKETKIAMMGRPPKPNPKPKPKKRKAKKVFA